MLSYYVLLPRSCIDAFRIFSISAIALCDGSHGLDRQRMPFAGSRANETANRSCYSSPPRLDEVENKHQFGFAKGRRREKISKLFCIWINNTIRVYAENVSGMYEYTTKTG
jgi:hypothetical protein